MAFFLPTFLAWLHFSALGLSVHPPFFVLNNDFIQRTSTPAVYGWLSADCEDAMTTPISCSAYFRTSVDENRSNDLMDLSSICTRTCHRSLAHYHESVVWACRNDMDPWPGVPATAYGDSIWINYKYACGKGPEAELDDYLYDYDDPLDEQGSSPYIILHQFYPVYPTSSAKDSSPNPDSPTPLTVQHNVKRDIVRDNNKRKWSVDAVACQQHTVQSGDTCWKIANTYRVTLAQLQSWNSFINADCTNLIIGDQLCVSDPAAGNSTVTTPTQATSTASTPYATATVAPPGPVARGTTSKCGRYYLVHSGDYCQRIVSNAGISLELFRAINPDLNADCTNLISGLYYCTLPMADWNKPSTTLITTTSVYVSAPGPTASGTTPNCFEWYVVQQSDYCAKLQAQFGITMAQLQQWNPELNRNCTNLLTGYAYCVHGEGNARVDQPAAVAATATATESIE
ncbi:uncharacterized protein KD926_001211 [Aspergillus affinis]|uniref:uncharacterized protein n=1 Tax=Aspergillus affinis TaxID=1070780 RepID=UPI0022FDDFAB|nr:uncharacterized protein KD926_001211 [Aspergillus affinis]KAI9036896.1 hypothetical protein KD926_001211 [Aspergillus affinis]